MEKKKVIPKSLKIGMKVSAICMGREIGRYIVTGASSKTAILKVENDPDSRSIYANRKIGENGLVTVEDGGLNIQTTEYFVRWL